jgi:preprotein translocase subunit YajC
MMLDSLLNVALIAQAGTPPGGSIIAQLAPIGIIILIFYFLMWRPQSKRQAAHRSFIEALQKGDEVVTEGGLLGKVTAVDDKTVTLDLGKGTKVKILSQSVRGSQASIVSGDDEEKDE